MQKRNRDLRLWITDEEREKLEALKLLSGNTYSSVVRKLIMDKEIRQRPDADFSALSCAVDRLGNNLNLIAKKAAATNAVSGADLNEAVSILREIRDEIDAWKELWL